MNTQKNFNQFFSKAKTTVFLEKKEKELLRSNILSFMKLNSVGHKQDFSWFSFMKRTSIAKYVSVASVIAILLGVSGVTFAAQNTLPGDMLYPIKVTINEKMWPLLLFSQEAKARYYISLAQLRLQETEAVASRGNLDNQTSSQIKFLLNEHLADARSHVVNVKGNAEISIGINSDLEASLNAHTQVLDHLADKNNDNVSQNLKKIVSDVESESNQVTKARQDSEQKLSGEQASNVKTSAEGLLGALENKITEVDRLIANKKGSVATGAYAQAQIDIANANALVTQGKDQLNSGNYSEAFVTFQQAMRIVQETQITLNATTNLHLELPSPSNLPSPLNINEHDHGGIKNNVNSHQ